MARRNKENEAKQALLAMRHEAGMFKICYVEMQSTLDQTFQCLGNDSITPEEADLVRIAMVNFHSRLQTAGSNDTSTILDEINAERCRLLNLYHAQENKLQGFAK